MTAQTYSIPASNYPWLTAKIEKLNKTAEKLGVAPIEVRVVREEVREIPDRSAGPGTNRFNPAAVAIKTYIVEVRGEAPILAGWRFVGTIQHVQDNGESATILRAVPGESISEYRDAGPEWCDHCKTARRRNDTFVVRSAEPGNTGVYFGERRRVGRQCLKDFLGHPKPEMYADWAESLSLLHDLFRGASEETGSTSDRVFMIEPFMHVTAAVIAQYGWVSGKMAYENPELTRTRTVVINVYMGDVEVKPTEETRRLAVAALDWARTALPELVRAKPDNDYLYNLQQVTKLDAIDGRMMGIAVSLIPAYQHELRRNAGVEERAARSKHFGEVGVRRKFVLTVVAVRPTNQGYNVVDFEDEEGNEAVWFTPGALEIGKTYTVAATVKRHGEWRGVRQTVLGRVKVQ